MAFRSDDQDFRWRRPGDRPQRQERPELAGRDAADELSLHDTLRELAVTIAGFAGIIALIVAAVGFLR